MGSLLIDLFLISTISNRCIHLQEHVVYKNPGLLYFIYNNWGTTEIFLPFNRERNLHNAYYLVTLNT